MIVGRNFVIATPTKTGAQSLSYWAKRRAELTYLPEGHRMNAPDEQMRFRYLMVRNPYARLYSIYKYLMRRETTEWGCIEARRLSFAAWVDHFLSMRSSFSIRDYDAAAPSIWLATLADCRELFVPHRFWRLEEIEDLPAHLGVSGPIPHLNRNPSPDPSPYTNDVDMKRVWDEWAGRDCELFGYSRQ